MDRLVLIGSAVRATNPGVLGQQKAVRTLEDPVPVDFIREFQESTAHVRLTVPFLERVIAESRKVPARVRRSALDGLLGADDADRLGQIAAPTLVVCGRQDGVFSYEEHEQLAMAIPAPSWSCARRRVRSRTGSG